LSDSAPSATTIRRPKRPSRLTPSLETGPIGDALNTEFDRQLEHLIDRGYPSLLEITPAAFRTQLEPLRTHLSTLETTDIDLENGKLPFVIVVNVPAAAAFARLEYKRKPAILSLTPAKLEDFKPIQDITIPHGIAYLLLEVDRGKDTLNVTPETALETIRAAQRAPLTMEEGIAVLIQQPEFLKKNHCFSLLASRRGDQRVPALWISAGQAKLGWCWDRNPHTWLGSASCNTRVGI
jgi:Family of unknown function (DUF5701)